MNSALIAIGVIVFVILVISILISMRKKKPDERGRYERSPHLDFSGVGRRPPPPPRPPSASRRTNTIERSRVAQDLGGSGAHVDPFLAAGVGFILGQSAAQAKPPEDSVPKPVAEATLSHPDPEPASHYSPPEVSSFDSGDSGSSFSSDSGSSSFSSDSGGGGSFSSD